MTPKNGFVACDNSGQPCKWKEHHQFPSGYPGFVSNCLSQQTPLVCGTSFHQLWLYKTNLIHEQARGRQSPMALITLENAFKRFSKVISVQIKAIFECGG